MRCLVVGNGIYDLSSLLYSQSMSESIESVKAPYATGKGQEARTEHECGDAAPKEGAHLYHFSLSTCSQKVRMALEHKGVSVQYHSVLLPLNDQYLPQYVRINPRCVVPSLVVNGKVTTDSKNILDHLDAFFPDSTLKLMPIDAAERKVCEHWTLMADEMPIHSVTYGEIEGIKKPFVVSRATTGHDEKLCVQLEKYVEQCEDDADLKTAYEEKLKVIESYTKIQSTDMDKVVHLVEKTLNELNHQLANGPFTKSGGFLYSQDLCVADIEWCVLLKRFAWIGAGARWVYNKEKLPNVGPYLDKLMSLKSYKDGIVSFDSKAKLVSLIAGRKWDAAMGKEVVL